MQKNYMSNGTWKKERQHSVERFMGVSRIPRGEKYTKQHDVRENVCAKKLIRISCKPISPSQLSASNWISPPHSFRKSHCCLNKSKVDSNQNNCYAKRESEKSDWFDVSKGNGVKMWRVFEKLSLNWTGFCSERKILIILGLIGGYTNW